MVRMNLEMLTKVTFDYLVKNKITQIHWFLEVEKNLAEMNIMKKKILGDIFGKKIKNSRVSTRRYKTKIGHKKRGRTTVK